MFYPQEMTEIEIIVPAKDLLPVTKALSSQGIFSQTDVNYLSTDKDNTQSIQWQEKASAYAGLERRLQSIINSLNIQDGNPLNRDYGTLADLDITQKLVDEIELKVKSSVEQINSETKNIEHLHNLEQQLAPLSEIEVDFSQLQNSRYVFTVLGMMPQENIERLKTSLARIPFVFYTLNENHQKAVVWLATSHENADILNRAVRSAYLDPIKLPDNEKGTPREILVNLRSSITESEKKVQQLKTILGGVRQEKEKQILELLWDVRCSHMMINAIIHYGRLKYTYIIVGWIYSSKIDWMKQKIKSLSPDAILEAHAITRQNGSADVPTALTNPRLIRPFQMLVTTYGEPKYGEIDPTPLVALLFPLLFGAMFGDVGHGAIIAIVGALVISKKVKFLNFFGSLGPILLACGISATIFGFLYGSVLGYEGVLKPLWMAPGANIMKILIITIAGGVIVLILGFLINIYNLLVAKNYSEAFLGHNGLIGLILYISLICLALPVVGTIFPIPSAFSNLPIPSSVFLVTLIIGLIGVMFSEVFQNLIEGRHPVFEGSIGIYFFQAFFELFDVVLSYVSNSLSFVRVGAFAVGHGNLAAVFFILAGMLGTTSSVGYWIMYLVGLVFIVGFEGLIVYIQTTRLTYYETFGKFFTGGGKRFEPLTLHPAEKRIN
jgi:V/A-type H+-transporting ATPase subunit I